MPRGLNLRLRQERKEFRDALVFVARTIPQHPQRRAADDGVLRRAFDIGPVWQHAIADFEFRIGLDVGARRRRADEYSAFTALESRLGRGSRADVGDHLYPLPGRELRGVATHK